MVYNKEKGWDSLTKEISPLAKSLLSIVREGKEAYDEWQSFRSSRTNIDIAADLTTLDLLDVNGNPKANPRTFTEAQVADLDAAFSAFDSIRRYVDNNTPPPSIDHGFALRVLS